MAVMSEDDRQFLTGMIKHHQAALDMSSSYLNKSKPSERQARVAALARNIIKAQTAEIAEMRGWLKSAGGPPPKASRMDM